MRIGTSNYKPDNQNKWEEALDQTSTIQEEELEAGSLYDVLLPPFVDHRVRLNKKNIGMYGT